MSHKYAGVTFDYYDDHGETLKLKFPTVEELPDMIKSADIRPKEKLVNEDFALVMVDEGSVYRKFACVDPGTTMMSVVYFMEHGDKLPETAQKLAASNLVDRCTEHGILPPAALTKMASDAQKSVVNVTGQEPKPIIKTARPTKNEDYAIILPNGDQRYPIDTWDRVKTAEAYWIDNRHVMQPEVRRQYAVKVAQKSFIMGYPLDSDIIEAGARSYHSDEHLQSAIDMRKVACDPGGNAREFLDELMEKHATMHPEVFAECLRRFDVDQDLDAGWGQVVLDPWASTFGIDKTSGALWEQGAERVTEEELINLARNHLKLCEDVFTADMCTEFQKDPIKIFNSLPDPQKKLLSRLAADSVSFGASEFAETKAPEQGPEGTKSVNYGP